MSIDRIYRTATGELATERTAGATLHAIQHTAGVGPDEAMIEITLDPARPAALVIGRHEIALTAAQLRNLQAVIAVALGEPPAATLS